MSAWSTRFSAAGSALPTTLVSSTKLTVVAPAHAAGTVHVLVTTAGGTSMAYLVSGGDVSKKVLDALNRIRAAAQIPCELTIPAPPGGHTVDLTRVNVIRTSASCVSMKFATTQTSWGTMAMTAWPIWTYAPASTALRVTRPASGA